MAALLTAVLLAMHAGMPHGLESRVVLQTTSNPVRKVVTMLQSMHKKITQEGEREKELYDKFMCYCKTYSDIKLQEAIASDKSKIDELTSAIQAAKGHLAQLGADLKKAKEEMAAAKSAIAEATAIREKEGAAYTKSSTEDKTNIAAIEKAIAAIKKGTGAEFIQTVDAKDLQGLVSKQEMDEEDKHELMAFLSQEEGSPGSDAIVGILANMLDMMKKNLADSTAAEEEAVSEYEQLMAAKEKEVKALMLAIEKKTEREGDLSVEYVDMTQDLEDTKESLKENQKLLKETKNACGTMDKVYETNKKMRSEELMALSDTIKILNDDDALDLFKKALPSKESFLQVKVNAALMRQRVLSALQKERDSALLDHRPQFDFIVMALRGKKIGFDKIIKMIDDMKVQLQKEQVDDENKKKFCDTEFDTADDKKKGLEGSISDLNTAIDDTKEGIATLKDEMAALKQGIKDLDESVKEATEQRKAEHQEYTQVMSDDAAAKEVLGFAKNRLNKFYNPKLYVPPPKKQLSAEDHIMAGMGGSSFFQEQMKKDDAPPPAPPASIEAYKKKGSQSTGVIEMIDLLISDLDKEMAQHEAEEKDSQGDYEKMMEDSAAKRAADSKTLDEKDSATADMESQLQKHKSSHKSDSKELEATKKYIASLHQDCDWLLKYFTVRKEARASEIQALDKAKAILNGADFSLVQVRRLTLRK
jgi:septal ring factor EnvC (AmiA/AmiB activator)